MIICTASEHFLLICIHVLVSFIGFHGWRRVYSRVQLLRNERIMKISITGIDSKEGKLKYADKRLMALRDKLKPKKYVPFYVDIREESYVQADVIVIKGDRILDLLILDLERCETRLKNSDDEEERAVLERCVHYLENETPLSDGDFSKDERKMLRALSMLSIKPVLVFDGTPPVEDCIEQALEKFSMFFYTAGPTEVHAWQVRKGATILECAAKIHTDLARGFIRGDVVPFDDFMRCHNMNEAKSKGLAKLVDRDHVVEPGSVIEIRSGV